VVLALPPTPTSAPKPHGAVPATRFNAPRPASAACELREIAQTSRRDASRTNVYAPPRVMPHARAPCHPSAGRRWSAGVGSRCARCVGRAESRELLRDGGWAQQHRPATRAYSPPSYRPTGAARRHNQNTIDYDGACKTMQGVTALNSKQPKRVKSSHYPAETDVIRNSFAATTHYSDPLDYFRKKRSQRCT